MDKNENLRKLGETLKKLAEAEKAKKVSPNQSISNLCKEGEKILAEETTPKVQEKKSVPENPYRKARNTILNKMEAWRRKEIEVMEQTGNTNNRHYAQFVVALMTEAGDIPSDELKLQAQ